MMKNKIYNQLEKVSSIFVTTISTILFILLGFTSLILTGQIELHEHTNFIFRYYWIFSIILYFILIYLILKNSDKIKEKQLFLIFTILYVIFALIISFSITSEPRADSAVIREAAHDFLMGNYNSFEHGRYFHYYPHQIPFMYYNILLLQINASGEFAFLLNSLMVLGINYFILNIMKILGDDNHKKNILIILLSFSFLPQFFFITFRYNLIPGFFLCTLSFWLYLRHLKNKETKDLILSIIFIVLATALRNNFAIALIAMVLYHLFFETRKRVGVYILLGFLVLNFTVNYGIKTYTESVTKLPVSEGNPKSMWIAMSTKPDNRALNAGWYTNWVTKVMKQYNYNYKKIDEVAKTQISLNFEYFFSHPKEMLSYFSEKFFTTWLEPSFQAFWSGPREIYNQPSYNSFVRSIYNKGSIYEGLFTFMNSILVLIYVSTLYYLVMMKKNRKYFLFLIYILGGVLFHLMWETKSQYVYPYVFMLLPIVVEVIYSIYKKRLLQIETKSLKNKKRRK